jgi:hypothetical protein
VDKMSDISEETEQRRKLLRWWKRRASLPDESTRPHFRWPQNEYSTLIHNTTTRISRQKTPEPEKQHSATQNPVTLTDLWKRRKSLKHS